MSEENKNILTTEKEAEQWFLKNSSGSVMVRNKEGKAKVVFSYPEAVEHINS